MPLLHRLACFRDDVVFLILRELSIPLTVTALRPEIGSADGIESAVYQMWIYKVDPNRENEYGACDRRLGGLRPLDGPHADSRHMCRPEAVEGRGGEAPAAAKVGQPGSDGGEAGQGVERRDEEDKVRERLEEFFRSHCFGISVGIVARAGVKLRFHRCARNYLFARLAYEPLLATLCSVYLLHRFYACTPAFQMLEATVHSTQGTVPPCPPALTPRPRRPPHRS